MDIIMMKFIELMFGPDVIKPSDGNDVGKYELSLMINSMMTIVFSHRYSKGDKFIREAEAESKNCGCSESPIDFSIIRDVMYKYSKKAQDKYFSYPIMAFFFAAFALSDEGIHFLQSKPDVENDKDKLVRLQSDLAELKKKAIESLQNQSKLNDSISSDCQQVDPLRLQQIKYGIYLFNELKKMTKGNFWNHPCFVSVYQNIMRISLRVLYYV